MDPIDDTKYHLFKLQRKHVIQIIKGAEHSYINATLTENKGNSKEIYNICNNLLGLNMLLPLPDYANPAILVQSFNNFSTDKIYKIIAIIDTGTRTHSWYHHIYQNWMNNPLLHWHASET